MEENRTLLVTSGHSRSRYKHQIVKLISVQFHPFNLRINFISCPENETYLNFQPHYFLVVEFADPIPISPNYAFSFVDGLRNN